MSQELFVVSEKGSSWAYDCRRTREAADALAFEMTNSEGKGYIVETVEEFEARKKALHLGEFNLSEISEDFHDQMLNCLPPMHRPDSMGFFMCEYTSGSITNQFVRYNGRYYGAAVDMADRATWITPEKIQALQPAPALAWFPKGADS
jgi:hypothetical protein